MTDNRNLLKLTAEQKQELQRWAQSRTLPAGDVFRARLLLALAEGIRYREIARSGLLVPRSYWRGYPTPRDPIQFSVKRHEDTIGLTRYLHN